MTQDRKRKCWGNTTTINQKIIWCKTNNKDKDIKFHLKTKLH